MVLPHPKIAFQRFLIRFENVVIGGDSAAGVDVLQRLEVRKIQLRKGLGLSNQAHHLILPLSEEPFPIRVVVKRATLKLLCALLNFGGLGDSIAANKYAAIYDPI